MPRARGGASCGSSVDPELVALIPPAYKSKGKIVAAVYNSPPYMYQDTAGNVNRGMLLEIYKEFEARTGIKVELKNTHTVAAEWDSPRPER